MKTLPEGLALFQVGDVLPDISPLVIAGVMGALVLFSLLLLFVSRYKRCPSNRVLVVYGKVGKGKAAEVHSGGGAFIWPVIQEYAFLDLTPLQIDIQLVDALSLENIRVRVPSVVTVAIGETEEYQQNAALRLLNLPQNEVQDLAANIIFGQMRQVIASMAIEEINRDREGFRANIEHALEPELKKIGLKLINVNIKDINDESGYIEAIGQKAGAQAVQQARGDVAEQEKLGETAVAEANQEKDIAVAEANRERSIGVAEADRDQAVRIADLERETTVAQQRAEFQRDRQIADADQERRVSIAAAEAEARTGETQANATVADAEAELQVRRAEAFERGETRRRVAEAAVAEAENRAMAKAAEAEAERIEAEQRAQLEAPARAEKARTIVTAEADGERRKIQAAAEAAAVYAKLEAEARGEFEKLSKKAEGLREIVDACGGADEAYRLLMLEHMDHLANKAAQAVQNIKFDKVVMWGGGNGGTGAGVSSFVTDVMGTLPPALHTMMNIGGVKFADGLVEVLADAESAESESDAVAAAVTAPAPPAKGGGDGASATVGSGNDRNDGGGGEKTKGKAASSPPSKKRRSRRSTATAGAPSKETGPSSGEGTDGGGQAGDGA